MLANVGLLFGLLKQKPNELEIKQEHEESLEIKRIKNLYINEFVAVESAAAADMVDYKPNIKCL